MVADNPDQKIELKAFHCEITNDHPYLQHSNSSASTLPIIRQLGATMINNNYIRIKNEVQQIIETEAERILNTPGLEHTIIKKD
jgi:hypothetical protein